jgi:exopolyphosphatase / guanosine-5'-triphosphate,3'-diphosphate pyrophosphatase
MGTNTFHLLIADVRDHDFTILFKEKLLVRIGEGGISQGFITEEATQRAIKALQRFREVLKAEQADKVFATATSAIRNAKNGVAFADRVHNELGIEVRIISGDEEAETIYYGVKKAISMDQEPVLSMDIGGGSIEFIIGNNTEILWKRSFEIGGQRLIDRFHTHDPILPEEVINLQSYLAMNLEPLFEACRTYQPKTLIGSSGTFDTLSDIYMLENKIEKNPLDTEFPFTLDAFEGIYEKMISLNREERLAVPGMIEMRVDMIVVASILIHFVNQKLDISNIRVSAYALKEGVLLKTIHSLYKKTA